MFLMFFQLADGGGVEIDFSSSNNKGKHLIHHSNERLFITTFLISFAKIEGS